MGFLSFFTFCVRLRCVLFFSCTIKVPFLIKIVYQNGTSRLIIYKNPPLVKPFFKFFIWKINRLLLKNTANRAGI